MPASDRRRGSAARIDICPAAATKVLWVRRGLADSIGWLRRNASLPIRSSCTPGARRHLAVGMRGDTAEPALGGGGYIEILGNLEEPTTSQ
jgi:hypothetical protein